MLRPLDKGDHAGIINILLCPGVEREMCKLRTPLQGGCANHDTVDELRQAGDEVIGIIDTELPSTEGRLEDLGGDAAAEFEGAVEGVEVVASEGAAGIGRWGGFKPLGTGEVDGAGESRRAAGGEGSLLDSLLLEEEFLIIFGVGAAEEERGWRGVLTPREARDVGFI